MGPARARDLDSVALPLRLLCLLAALGCAATPPSSPVCPEPPSIAPPPQVATGPETLVANLQRAIARARCTDPGAAADTLDELDDWIERARVDRGDVPPLGRMRVLLDHETDPSLDTVREAMAALQGSYAYGAPVPGRPTLFLIHGSDRGPFDTFRPYLEEYRDSANLVFVLYDSFHPTAAKAQWLSGEVRAWQETHPGDVPRSFLTWSDGATVLRKARLDDTASLYRDATIVNLAPPLAGSYRARWVADPFWMRLFSSPARVWLGQNPHLTDMARDYDPYGSLMAEMYGPAAEARLDRKIGTGSELHVIAEGDDHAPSEPIFGFVQPDFDEYLARYRASLVQDHVVVPALEEHPHQAVTRHPATLRAVRGRLPIEPAGERTE